MIDALKPYPATKPSGIEGVGDIPAHWKVMLNQRILKEKIRAHNGESETQLSLSQRQGLVPTSVMEEGSLQTATFENWKVTVPGDLVLNRFKAHLGVFFAATLRGIVSFHYGVFAPRVPLNPKYFEILYHTPAYRSIYAGRSNGMTVGLQNLSNQNFYNVHSIVPPVEEQAAIVGFVDHADRRIRKYIGAKRKLIALLNEQKQAIIHRAVARGLDPKIRLKSSGVDWLADNPEHWTVRRIKYVLHEVDRRTDTGREVLLSLRMYKGLVPHNDVSKIPIPTEALVGFKRVDGGQLVMNRMRAAIGMFGVAPQSGLVSPDYAVFEIGQEVHSEYLLRLFKTPTIGAVFRIESRGLGTGSSGFMRLYTDRFGAIAVALPPLAEQSQILEVIGRETAELDLAVERCDREISLLREYRTSLIAQVVTGGLDVRNVSLSPELAASSVELEANGDEGLEDGEEEVEEAVA